MIKKISEFHKNGLVLGVSAALAILLSGEVLSADSIIDIDIKSQKAGTAFLELAEKSGVQILIPKDIGKNIDISRISGEFTLSQALERMLSGTGLSYRFIDENLVIIDNKEDAKSKVEADKSKVEEIVVTGSHFKRNPGELDRQVTVYARDDIQATGATTFDEFMRDIPQNFNAPTENGSGFTGNFGSTRNYFGASGVNLRGLGEKATLILIDGKRTARGGVLGEVVDISTIPLSMVERVELIFDGASSLYGADAVGGVVNIITRKDYEGVQVGIARVQPELGGTSETTFTLGGTYSWDTGSATANYQYLRRSTLTGDERELRFNTFNGTLPAGIPGNVESASQWVPALGRSVTYPLFSLDANGNPVANDSPDAVTPIYRTQLPAGDGTNLQLSDFAGQEVTAGSRAESGRSLIPARDDHSIHVSFRQEMPGDLLLSGGASYSTGESDSFETNQTFTVNVWPYNAQYNTGSPYTPFMGPINIALETPYLPDTLLSTKKKNSSVNFSLDGQFSESWDWTLSAGASRSDNSGMRTNAVNSLARNWLGSPGESWVPDAIKNMNIFNDSYFGLSSAEEVVDALVIPSQKTENLSDERIVEFVTQGALWSLPGGEVHSLIGVGSREEENYLYDEGGGRVVVESLRMWGNAYEETTRRRNNFVKAEVNVPVVGEANSLPGIQSLDVTFSGHYDEYMSYGSELNETDEIDPERPWRYVQEESSLTLKDSGSSWSIGLVWRPLDWLQVRANKSTSFSMPALVAYALPADRYQGDLYLYDEEGNWTPETTPVIYVEGGNPTLRPEQSVTNSIGFTITPTAIPEFVARINLHSNKYTDKIDRLGTLEALTRQDLLNYQYNDAISIDPLTGLPAIDRRAFNTGQTFSKGMDVELSYYWDTAIGQFNARLDYGYLGTSDWVKSVDCGGGECESDTITKRVNRIEHVGVSDGTAIPQHRGQLRLGWRYNGWNVDVSTSYSSNTIQDTYKTNPETFEYVEATNTTKAPKPVNVVVRYDFDEAGNTGMLLKGTILSLSVPNIFMDDAEIISRPAFSTDAGGIYNPIYDRPRGRTFTLSLTKKFE